MNILSDVPEIQQNMSVTDSIGADTDCVQRDY